MEALTAASVAALTVYDMVKGIERGVEIAELTLLEKSGGRTTGAASRERWAALTISTSLANGEGEDAGAPLEQAGLEVQHEVVRTTASRSWRR